MINIFVPSSNLNNSSKFVYREKANCFNVNVSRERILKSCKTLKMDNFKGCEHYH